MSRIAQDLATSLHNSSTEDSHQAPDNSGSVNMQRVRLGKLPKVAIIGAGMSGLRCADVLTRAGAHVTMFEARNRIGGRVHQVDNGGYLVDTGSNWIHGTEGNPIMTIAEKTKTTILEPEERSVIFDIEGRQKSEKDSGTISEEFWATILKAFKYSDKHSATTDEQTSLFRWLKDQWSDKFKGDPGHVHTLLEESRMFGQFVGSPVTTQSLKFFWLEEGLDGENVFVASTYKRILEEVAKPALAKADIKLNTEVNHIAYRTSDDEAPVRVYTSEGASHSFDEVVVTCPLGWLKKHAQTVFSPPLPHRLAQAIESIGYGALEKLYISFPTSFWLDNNDKTSYPGFTTFHTPQYHPDPASKDSTTWNQSVVALSHMPSTSAQPTLLFYMHGDCGAYLTNKLSSHEPHSETYNAILKEFAEPFYSRLPNYSVQNVACKPTSFYLTSWQTDPYAGYGSYSTFRTGLQEGDKDIEVIRDAGGLGDKGQGLWMAGEHTAPFVALGTTTGAYWSGEGIARRIAKQYGLTFDEDKLCTTSKKADTDRTSMDSQLKQKNVGKAQAVEP